MIRTNLVLFVAIISISSVSALEPIPDKLVVLTFDDASKSHFTVARPLLKKYGFGATFFVTEGFDFPTNKKDYMTWKEIAQLHQDGFEIGNHTKDHLSITQKTVRDLAAQLKGINDRCKEYDIPIPTSFAYPGNGITKEALPILKDLGIRFARRGGSPEYPYKEGRGFAYEPGLDHPYLLPSTGDARPAWTLEDFKRAVNEAKQGKIAILQFHGVPDTAHEWVNSTQEQFEQYMKYLADNKFTVIAMRDLAKYVNPQITPTDPFGVIEDRKRLLETKQDGNNTRPAKSDDDLKYWLENAITYHRFTPTEAGAALGLSAEEVLAAIKRLQIAKDPPKRPANASLLVLPYPGGKHPRIGFRDGAIRPQRETKVSIFAPWGGGYVVADVPEAVWFEPNKQRELLYLAHTHIPTFWDKQKTKLEPMEWTRNKDGSFILERVLPNQVTMTSKIVPGQEGVRMEFRITNGSKEKLTGLRVQMCVMLAGLDGFNDITNENKAFAAPFAACRDSTKNKWVITGWQRCGRAWGNPPCPCIHADPVVEDCAPGETKSVRGWISFYPKSDIDAELKRLQKIAFE